MPEHDEALVEQRHRDAVSAHARNRMNHGETLQEAFARFEQSIRTTDAARIAELEADLEHYADQFCEHGKHSEVCGRLGPDDCSGCRARTTLRSNPDAVD